MIQKSKDGTLLNIHVVVNSPKNEIKGAHGNAIKVKIHAPPVDNKANLELIKFIADLCKVAKSSIEIVSGRSSRQKKLLIRGKAPAELEKTILKKLKT